MKLFQTNTPKITKIKDFELPYDYFKNATHQVSVKVIGGRNNALPLGSYDAKEIFSDKHKIEVNRIDAVNAGIRVIMTGTQEECENFVGRKKRKKRKTAATLTN